MQLAANFAFIAAIYFIVFCELYIADIYCRLIKLNLVVRSSGTVQASDVSRRRHPIFLSSSSTLNQSTTGVPSSSSNHHRHFIYLAAATYLICVFIIYCIATVGICALLFCDLFAATRYLLIAANLLLLYQFISCIAQFWRRRQRRFAGADLYYCCHPPLDVPSIHPSI